MANGNGAARRGGRGREPFNAQQPLFPSLPARARQGARPGARPVGGVAVATGPAGLGGGCAGLREGAPALGQLCVPLWVSSAAPTFSVIHKDFRVAFLIANVVLDFTCVCKFGV